MKVIVNLHGHLTAENMNMSSGSSLELVLGECATLGDLLAQIGLIPDQIGFVVRKGVMCPTGYQPADGDVFDVFPLLAGG